MSSTGRLSRKNAGRHSHPRAGVGGRKRGSVPQSVPQIHRLHRGWCGGCTPLHVGLVLLYTYQITRCDPAGRAELGRYTGSHSQVSDHSPVEAAYLEAVAAFAEKGGMQRLATREPKVVSGFVHFGLEPPAEYHGLADPVPGTDLTLPDRHLLLTSVLPMLTERRGHADTPTHPGWPDWAFLETLRRGQIVTDSVTQTTDSGLTSVDIGSLTAMTSRPGRRCQVRQKATDTAASPGACRGRLAAVGPASGRLSCPSGSRTVDSPLP